MTTATASPYFLYSMGILFREGMEAILVIIALAAGVRQIGSQDRRREIYSGALAAVAVSIGLAWAANHFLSDNASDTLEGLFQFLAAATLFYVSSWLTGKTQADRWNDFIRAQARSARESAQPTFALATTAFLCVMREGAETIVFFQALIAGATESAERHAIAAGVAAGAAALAIAFVVLGRAAARIPLRPFFAITSILLYAMAIIFVGQGVASWQEAGIVHATFVDYAPTIKALGLFPTIEGLGAQAALLIFAAIAIIAPRRWRLRTRRASESGPAVRPA